jgi:hypothetical protein
MLRAPYANQFARDGGQMAETMVSSPRSAEISERSSELMLPGENQTAWKAIDLRANGRSERESDVSESEITATSLSGAHAPEANYAKARARSLDAPVSPLTPSSDLPSDSSSSGEPAPGSTSPPSNETASVRGRALPGDRGPRNVATPPQRPSFWRRIALGRRSNAVAPAQPDPRTLASSEKPDVATMKTEAAPSFATRARNAVAPAIKSTPAAPVQADTSAIENRIIEPLLQALVSVEAKLERSHGELVGRSDQVEQRLTQLWDIEEQLGTLSELQESLHLVSEQQRRLELAVVTQTKTLRWLVGAVFLSLAAATFVVAAVLR